MTPEEYQRLKEAEKKHLKELKELKQRARTAGRSAKAFSALQQMKNAVTNLDATQDDAMERLTHQQAMQDARLDIALGAAAEKAAETERTEASEAELKRLKADALIRQMKIELGDASASSAAKAAPSAPRDSTDHSADPTPPTDGLPEKTLGRMKPPGDEAS